VTLTRKPGVAEAMSKGMNLTEQAAFDALVSELDATLDHEPGVAMPGSACLRRWSQWALPCRCQCADSPLYGVLAPGR
jgi:hypothetical protein